MIRIHYYTELLEAESWLAGGYISILLQSFHHYCFPFISFQEGSVPNSKLFQTLQSCHQTKLELQPHGSDTNKLSAQLVRNKRISPLLAFIVLKMRMQNLILSLILDLGQSEVLSPYGRLKSTKKYYVTIII